MWKLAHGYQPKVVSDLFTGNLHNQIKFVLPHPRNESAKSYLVYSCIKEWNAVPDTLKLTSTQPLCYREFHLAQSAGLGSKRMLCSIEVGLKVTSL